MKKIMNLDQLNAMNMLYETKLTTRSLIQGSIFPALYLPVLLYTILWRWWLIPVGFGLGLAYGVLHVLPLRIKARYQQNAFKARNRLMNNLTQALHRKHCTVLDGLNEVARFRLSGELKRDVEQLASRVATQSIDQRKAAYDRLSAKYEHDRLFVQYVEHLITVDQLGASYLEPLDETAKAHDKAMQWQAILIAKKKEALIYFLTNNLLAYVLAAAVIGLTWENHVQLFTQTILGWGLGLCYLGFTFYFNHRFLKDYHDEQLMEVKL